MNCPNINDPNWIRLTSSVSENIAYYLWDKYDGMVPEKYFALNQVNYKLKSIDILLFESNPELANAVYEAAGFNNNVVFKLKPYATDIWGKVPKQRGDNNFVNKEQYSVKINTENRGIDIRLTIYFDDSNKTAFVSNIENFENDVTHPLKKGLGLKAFLQANKLIIERGYTPVIDNLVSGYGYDMLLKLEKQGFLSKVLDKSISNSQYDNVKYEKPPFSFTNKIYNNQITPQQKQEAQQLYSQYLEQNPNGNVEQFKSWVDSNQSNVQYQLPQGREQEEFVASEKTIRDLAARISDRIGIPVRFESDRTKEYKGKLENGTAVVNLAHATLDTPIHEILGHPIIRAIKGGYSSQNKYITSEIEITQRLLNKEITKEEAKKLRELRDNPPISQLYQNLLKELEYGRGKEVLDRVKRDYDIKTSKYQKLEDENDINHIESVDTFKIGNDEYKYEYKEFEGYSGYYPSFTKDGREIEFEEFKQAYNKNIDSLSVKYTLEEQQEEAIVELLGLMTAEKLDNVKDGKLISLLKRLLKEMKQFVRSLLNQKEVEIDKLPDNMTLGDLSDLLAYSNSKLILPGYEVEYTTPDNEKFKTYQEASNYISELAKSVENVDLRNIKVENELPDRFVLNEFDEHNATETYFKENGQWYLETQGDTFVNKEKITEEKAKKDYTKYAKYQGNLNSFIEKNKEYEQSKEIIEEWKKVNNIQYNPEEIYSRGQEFSSVVGAYSSFDVNLMMQNLLSHIEDNEKANNHNKITSKDKIVFGHPGIGKTYLRESGRTDVIDFDSDYKIRINEKFNLPEGFKARNDFQKSNKEEYQKAVRELWIEAKKESKKTGKQLFASDMILLREFANDFDKVITMSKETFVNRAKQRNDYTQGETESWKNSLDTEINKLDKSRVINTTDYLSNLFSKGSGFAISAYTKPVDRKIGHLEGGGGKIKFKIYPQSQDILWAANTDVYSGSVWDASEKVNKDKKSELLGVSYTKYPSLENVNSVQPNLASIVDDLAHHHNELGISLTGNNFRLEYDEDIPYTTKKIIDGINKILDQKYGKLVKPEIKQKQKIKDLEEILAYYNGNIIESPQKVIINGKEIKSFVFDISLGKKFKSVEEAEEFRKSHILELKSRISNDINIEIPFNAKKDFFENLIGIQPTQTNKTLKESIESVKRKNTSLKENQWTVEPYAEGEYAVYTFMGEFVEGQPTFKSLEEANTWLNQNQSKEKEYTSQALINTKIAKLKGVAKKYPRSLIRSEVRPIFGAFVGNDFYAFDKDELPFQKIPSPNKVNYSFKASDVIVNNIDKIKSWEKQIKDPNILYKKIQELGASKQTMELLQSSEGNTVEEKLINFLANYSYTVEINTTKEKEGLIKDGTEFKVGEDYYYSDPNRNVYKILYSKDNGGGSKNISKQEFENARQSSKPTSHYSNLTVPGGTNGSYKERNFETPLIKVPKSHAQFNTENTIGFTRGDDRIVYTENDIESLLATMQNSGILKIKCD
jgi:hypothetical protein